MDRNTHTTLARPTARSLYGRAIAVSGVPVVTWSRPCQSSAMELQI
ncbi:MAG TPA: hypothetical protein VGK04_04945 [Thermoanaerobaculia bacterium]